MRLRAPLLLKVADALAEPIFVVDGERRLHFANRAADAMWGNGCGLCRSGGVVLADESALQAAFVNAVATTLHGRSAIPLSLALKPRADGRCDVLHFAPLHVLDEDTRPAHGGRLVNCHVRLNGLPAGSDAIHLRQAFALSEVEADVAAMVVAGRTARRIAGERDCSEDTVRWHIKNLYAKTFAHGLVDLVLQLSAARSPFFVAPAGEADDRRT
jgi:DNA-binding CsgD family transcriptional regulator